MPKHIEVSNIGWVTLVGHIYHDDKFPRSSGNCFSVTNDQQSWKIVNFAYENIKELIHRGIGFPFRIDEIGAGVALLDDPRIPESWYNNEYCTTCCPDNLLTEPQRKQIARDIEVGARKEISTKDGYSIIRFDHTKHPDVSTEKETQQHRDWLKSMGVVNVEEA